MAITKAEILSRINDITRRELTDIDEELEESLRELSERTCTLKASVSGTLSASSFALPAGIYLVNSFILNGLTPLRITMAEYMDSFSGYAVDYDGGNLYVYPAPSGQAYTLYYTKYGTDVDSIEFADKWKMALVYLTASKIYENFELKEDSDRMLSKYELELLKHNNPEPVIATLRR